MTATVFIKWRNRAVAQLASGINGSVVDIPLVAGQGARLTQVLTASGDKVRAQIIERDPTSGEVIACELVDITNNVSDVLKVTRAVEATRATDATNTYSAAGKIFSSAAYIEEVISSEVVSEMQNAINNLENNIPTTYATKAEVAAGSLVYGASSQGNDTYQVSIPNISAYTQGFKFSFLADVGNTWQAYVRVVWSAGLLATLEILKNHDQSLATGDIEAGQIVEVVVNTTEVKAQMSSGVATVVDLSSYSTRTENMTLGEDVVSGDIVYPSAADTVKRIGPSAMVTWAAITTAPTTLNATRSMPLSTNGLYLHVSGGSANTAAILYGQVRTINAWETDFTNGSEATIYGTGQGVTIFDICNIWVDKFLLIFQAATGGVEVGIKTVVISVSGTTITVWSVQTIETTGAFSNRLPSCAKLGTDKAIIFYQKDADLDIYGQVLTVSTTTITTNTPVSVRVTANNCQTYAVSLGTDAGMVLYCDNSQYLYWRTFTVSGTVPTFATEQQVYNNSSTISSGNHVWLWYISATKVLLVFGESSAPTNDFCAHLTISGATITKWSNLSLSATAVTDYFGIAIIGTSFALVADFSSNTQIVLRLLDISGATPTQISSQNLSIGTTSNNYEGISVVKVLPWTYMVSGPISNWDYIVKLTPIATRIGIMESTGLSGATAAVTLRFQKAILSGLTAWSIYYVDDNAQPTLKSSLTAISLWVLGVSKSTTSMLLN